MNIDWNKVEIYIKPGHTDMRKQMRTLAVYVAEEIKGDPLSGNLYVFCGRNRRFIKALYWDRNGFCLWQKRLEEDQFPWPRDEGEARKISAEQMRMILDGIDFFRAHKKLIFSAVS
jgi:transposase